MSPKKTYSLYCIKFVDEYFRLRNTEGFRNVHNELPINPYISIIQSLENFQNYAPYFLYIFVMSTL